MTQDPMESVEGAEKPAQSLTEASETCGLCWRPATGLAYIGDTRLCHGDFEPDPTCYMKAQHSIHLYGSDGLFPSHDLLHGD